MPTLVRALMISSLIWFSGCGFGEAARGWVVEGELHDAASGAVLVQSDVSIRLRREGERLGEDGFVHSNAQGQFSAYAHEGFSGSGFILFSHQPLSPVLGASPDEVEVFVRSGNGMASFTMPIAEQQVTRPDAVTGIIQLGSIQVTLGPNDDIRLATGESPNGFSIGDIDGDRDLDLVVATADMVVNDDEVEILLNNGDATFADFQTIPAGDHAAAALLGDINADGSLDLGVMNAGEDMFALMTNDGAGNFAALGTYVIRDASWSGNDLTFGDVNGDSKLDLLALGYDELTIFLNDGSGQLADPESFPTGTAAGQMVLSDLDGDHDVDVAITNGMQYFPERTGAVSILLNRGDGSFENRVKYSAGSDPSGIAAGDVDGDGDIDLCVAARDDKDIAVLLNDGYGGFEIAQRVGHGQFYGVVLRDLNFDGRPDLIATESGTLKNISVFTNEQDGDFELAFQLTARGYAHNVRLANFDEDEHLDLVVANSYDDSLSLFLNLVVP